MTDKAKVVIECGGHERSYEVSPGETLVVEATHHISARFRPAKRPQPEVTVRGYRYRLTDGRLEWSGGDKWHPIKAGGEWWKYPASYLRTMADLIDATDKWAAS